MSLDMLTRNCPVTVRDLEVVNALGTPIAVANNPDNAMRIALLMNTGATKVLKRRRAVRARRLRQAEKERRAMGAPLPPEMVAELFGCG